MKVRNFKEIKIFNLKKYKDIRGYFFENYNKNNNPKLPIFNQDNISFSKKPGTLRGIHFQKKPFQQGKLISVISGSIQDIVIDIRKGSKNYGNYISILISSKNNKQVYIPPGFAHGFLTLEKNTLVLYKVSNVYNKNSEVSILWNDKELNIKWKNKKNIVLSKKDKNGIGFKQIND